MKNLPVTTNPTPIQNITTTKASNITATMPAYPQPATGVQNPNSVTVPGKPAGKFRVKAKISKNAGTSGASANAMNLLEFTRKFPDEKACREYLFHTRWAQGFKCPRCEGHDFYFHSTRNLYQCKSCWHQSSITSGTIFHKTRTPLQKWFGAIFLMSIQKVGISSLSLQRILDIPCYRTIWTICHKIRKAMADENKQDKNSLMLNIPSIPGISGIIEIGDTYLGTTKAKKAVLETKNLISLDMGIPYTEMKVLPSGFQLPPIQNTNKNQLQSNDDETPFIFISNKNILYKPISKKKPNKSGNTAQSTNPGQPTNIQGDRNANPILHWVGILVGNLRTNLHGTFHGIGDKYLQRFLDEYCFRFNRREKPQEIFQGLLNACAKNKTIMYKELKI